MSLRFEDLAEAAGTAGLRAVDRGGEHWQILGGVHLVNFYPHGQPGREAHEPPARWTSRHEKGPLTMTYREGARDHCYHCGRPRREHRGEHRGERLSCPEGRSKYDRRMWAEEESGERVAPKRPCP